MRKATAGDNTEINIIAVMHIGFSGDKKISLIDFNIENDDIPTIPDKINPCITTVLVVYLHSN